MSLRQSHVTRALSTRFLAVGFACALTLALLTIGIAMVEASRVERETLDVATRSQRATYYLGEVGEQLGRLRSRLRIGLRSSPEEFRRQEEALSQIRSDLQTAIERIPEALSPSTLGSWPPLRQRLEQLLEVYDDAATALAAEQPSRASQLLRGQAATAAIVYDELEEISRRHRRTALVELQAAHQRGARSIILELVLAGVFLVGTTVIWILMTAVLRRQKRVIAEYTERLERANEDLDAFAGRVAHDLRNALGSVVMGGDLLRDSGAVPLPMVDVADRMNRSAQRAIALVDSLLAFSRPTEGEVDDADEVASVPAAVTSVLEELAPEVERFDVTVELTELPELTVRCSSGLLHIVLANLCGNAVKFLKGREERLLRIGARADDSLCRIEIEDSGPGIPEDARERIFEPFYRVEGSRAPGTGIGLATVRRILDARGGRVAVESRDEGGSRFVVWLPLALPLEPPADEAAAHRAERERAVDSPHAS